MFASFLREERVQLARTAIGLDSLINFAVVINHASEFRSLNKAIVLIVAKREMIVPELYMILCVHTCKLFYDSEKLD